MAWSTYSSKNSGNGSRKRIDGGDNGKHSSNSSRNGGNNCKYSGNRSGNSGAGSF